MDTNRCKHAHIHTHTRSFNMKFDELYELEEVQRSFEVRRVQPNNCRDCENEHETLVNRFLDFKPDSRLNL